MAKGGEAVWRVRVERVKVGREIGEGEGGEGE